MLISLFGYVALVGILVAVALYFVDRIVKVKTNGLDTDIAGYGAVLGGFVVVGIVAASVVAVFTGVVTVLFLFLAVLSVVLGGIYCWRIMQARNNRELFTAMLDEEEKMVIETTRRDPANAAAWSRLSEINEKKGNSLKALEYAKKAGALDPTPLNYARIKDLQEDR